MKDFRQLIDQEVPENRSTKVQPLQFFRLTELNKFPDWLWPGPSTFYVLFNF